VTDESGSHAAARSAEADDTYAFVAELYDYVVPYRERQDVSFFIDAAKESGGPVLEIGCGTGRVLIPIARAGVEIVGLDLSPQMLAVCRRHLAGEAAAVRARVELRQGDMRRFQLGRTFPLITIPFRPFQHLIDVEDQMACLQAIRRHLTPDGRLILDLFNPSIDALASLKESEEIGDEPAFTTPEGLDVVRRHASVRHDRFNQINYIELIYYVTHPDGRKERIVHSFPMRYLYRFEAEHLLARCGFEIEHLYASYDKAPYGSIYPGELVIVARHARG